MLTPLPLVLRPSNNTPYISKIAKESLRKIFRKGYRYHKVGMMLIELVPDTLEQFDLFMPEFSSDKTDKLMATIDKINALMGKNSVQFCAEGIQKKWQIKCDRRSPRYTTRKDELKKVTCK